MSKIHISYRSFPNCREATEYSKSRTTTSVALRLLGGLLTFGFGFYLYNLTNSFSDKILGELIAGLAIFLCILIFDFYAFIWRMYQTKYRLELIFIDEAYRQTAIYGEEERSEQYIKECKAKRKSEKKQAKEIYKKTLRKSAIIYSVCVFVGIIVIALGA